MGCCPDRTARKVASHLGRGVCFVIEVGLPGLERLPPGETIRAFRVSEMRWGVRRVRRRDTTSHLRSLSRSSTEELTAFFGSLPVRLALGARPDGGACRDAIARALEWVEGGAVHERQSRARFGLGKTGSQGRILGAPANARRGHDNDLGSNCRPPDLRELDPRHTVAPCKSARTLRVLRVQPRLPA